MHPSAYALAQCNETLFDPASERPHHGLSYARRRANRGGLAITWDVMSC